jgi:hypothetical protein
MYSVVVTTLSGDVTTYNISIGGSVGDVGDLAVGDSRSNPSSSTPFSFFHRGRQVAASTPLAGLVDDSGNVVKLVLVSYTGSRAKKRQRRRGEANTTDSLFDRHGSFGLCDSITREFGGVAKAAVDTLEHCGCEDGCPMCCHVASCGCYNGHIAKKEGLELLREIITYDTCN